MLGQLDGRLAAELYHHRVGTLGGQHVVHILRRQRIKIQPVGGVEIGGHGLRVVVGNDGLIAQLFQRADAVDRAVVELDALTNADGAGAEHDDTFFARMPLRIVQLRLVFIIPGGVEIRRLRVEFRRAGIHHLIGQHGGCTGSSCPDSRRMVLSRKPSRLARR